MNIIIPMAGMGKRMRPHTLTIPKPLIPIAGKPIVHRLVEDIVAVANTDVNQIAFIISPNFDPEIEQSLIKIAEGVNAKGIICYQEEALGTAHAILCAKNQLEGNVIVAFADTLFKADFKLDTSQDGVIWVQQIEDPSAFGVVKLNDNNIITEFIEKPEQFVSDLAIVGIYYFRDGEFLKKELQYLLDNDIKDKGEYQLTNALENMKNKGVKFTPGQLKEWLDCGNKNATVYTNQRYLEFIRSQNLVADSASVTNSMIIDPVFIDEGVSIDNSVIGPHVSIGKNTKISDSVIKNSIIQTNTNIKNSTIRNSMIGNYVKYSEAFKDLSIGDYNTIHEKG